jgi:hypothetical protein
MYMCTHYIYIHIIDLLYIPTGWTFFIAFLYLSMRLDQGMLPLSGFPILNKWCTAWQLDTSFADPLVVFNRNLTMLYIKWITERILFQITQEIWQSEGGCWCYCKCLSGEDSHFFVGDLPPTLSLWSDTRRSIDTPQFDKAKKAAT